MRLRKGLSAAVPVTLPAGQCQRGGHPQPPQPQQAPPARGAHSGQVAARRRTFSRPMATQARRTSNPTAMPPRPTRYAPQAVSTPQPLPTSRNCGEKGGGVRGLWSGEYPGERT